MIVVSPPVSQRTVTMEPLATVTVPRRAPELGVTTSIRSPTSAIVVISIPSSSEYGPNAGSGTRADAPIWRVFGRLSTTLRRARYGASPIGT
jgi:hypothetical protein